MEISEIMQPVVSQTPGTLPDNYLSDGYYAVTEKGDKYLRPEFVGNHAQYVASALSPMKPSDFSGLLREMKRNRKRSLPYEARLTAASEMLPKALSLIRRKKAPHLLFEVIQANLAALHNDDDWQGFYRHCEAIYGYLTIEDDAH